MNIKRFFQAFIVFLFPFTAFAQQTVTTATELKRLSDITKMPEYIDGSFIRQISSYDRTGGNDDGFSGKYSYIRKEKDGLVLLDVKGRGVIERIWTPTPTDDIIEFYFDGNAKPGLSIKFSDLFSGKVAPFLKPLVEAHLVGGYYSYVPIPYEKGCKIVFKGEKIMFHQIQYRELDDNYKVQTFHSRFNTNEHKILQDVIGLWNNNDRQVQNFYAGRLNKISVQKTVHPGETVLLADLRQGGRIQGFEFKSSKIFEGLSRQLDLKITWDNESAPAVYAPAADFFGYAFGKKSMESLLLGATASKAYCYFPMPFDKSAKIELVYRKTNETQQPLSFTFDMWHAAGKRNPAREGKFYALWKNNEPAAGEPYVFLNGNGRGHYVGTLLQSQATTYNYFTEFFEGDDSTVIDGVQNIHGTGSEDYFNGGWYAQPGGWVEKLGGPVSGCLDYSIPWSRTGGYRIYVTDKLPFYKNIYHSMEHGPVNNNRPVNNTSVAMYYADKAVQVNTAPANENTKVFLPPTYTFYPAFLKHLTYNGNYIFRDGRAAINDKQASLTINVDEVPAGKYKLYMHKVMSQVKNLEVRIADNADIQQWRSIHLNAGNTAEEIYLGEVEIRKNEIPQMPLNLLFRSKDNTPEVEFDRIMLQKL